MAANPVPTMGAHWPFALKRCNICVSYMNYKEGNNRNTGQFCALTNACERLDLIRDWTAEKINLSYDNNSKPRAPKNGNGHDGEEVANFVVHALHSPLCCAIGARDGLISWSIVNPAAKAKASCETPMVFEYLVCHRRHPDDGMDAATGR